MAALTMKSIAVSSSCPLEYLEQPPDQLDCNPFTRGELLLECTAIHHPQALPLDDFSSSALTVNWYHRPEAGGRLAPMEDDILLEEGTALTNVQLVDLQDHISIREQQHGITSSGSLLGQSSLQLYGLNESNVGAYWCSILLSHSNDSSPSGHVAPSDPVLLGHVQEHAHKEQCSTNIAQSKQVNKCALRGILPLPALGEVTVEEEEEEVEGKGLQREFYTALAILIAFGSTTAVLALAGVCTYIQYRKKLKGMEVLTQFMHGIPKLTILFVFDPWAINFIAEILRWKF